jgi:molecular chaperone DnaJ
VSVPTVSGHATLDVPPGTQSGHVFHLRGRGLPRVNAAGMGDLHVRVQLWTPERVTEEERQIIARLGELQPGVPADGRSKGFWAKMKEALGA